MAAIIAAEHPPEDSDAVSFPDENLLHAEDKDGNALSLPDENSPCAEDEDGKDHNNMNPQEPGNIQLDIRCNELDIDNNDSNSSFETKLCHFDINQFVADDGHLDFISMKAELSNHPEITKEQQISLEGLLNIPKKAYEAKAGDDYLTNQDYFYQSKALHPKLNLGAPPKQLVLYCTILEIKYSS
jgi:hypothetical protein